MICEWQYSYMSFVWRLKNGPAANFLHFPAHLILVGGWNVYGQDYTEIADDPWDMLRIHSNPDDDKAVTDDKWITE